MNLKELFKFAALTINFPKKIIHEKNPYPFNPVLFLIPGPGPGPVQSGFSVRIARPDDRHRC